MMIPVALIHKLLSTSQLAVLLRVASLAVGLIELLNVPLCEGLGRRNRCRLAHACLHSVAFGSLVCLAPLMRAIDKRSTCGGLG